ncbi:4-(cytidine 5'-diphospho)-2-C-methyl-D-erythritol kinase [Hydrogenophaga soli]
MQTLYDLPAPAKINLFLHITGRRADGYHLMQSAFVLLDLHDTLHLCLRTDGQVSREDLQSPHASEALPHDDLSVKAAKLLKQATGSACGVHITLQKRIPSQAGMGGGSSDAATVLLALNRLWNTHLSRTDLMRLGLQLGADVPFFLFGDNAWAEGIGEQLQPLDWSPQRYLVVKPPQGLPTAAIFSDPNLKRDTKAATMQGFADHCKTNSTLFGCNNLQPVAQQHCPSIRHCIDWLARQGLQGRMTGSGSAVFAPAVNTLTLPAAPEEWFLATANSLPEHPLKRWI